METLLIVLCVVIFLLAAVALSPVVIAVDSRNRQVRVRWLLALEFRMPLPGAAGQKYVVIFHKPFPIREQQAAAEFAGQKKGKPAEPVSSVRKALTKRRTAGRFLARCLGDSEIRRALARQVSLLLRRIFGSVNLTRADGNISFPEPALNGMLAGALAASNCGSRSGVRVNFVGENNLFLEVRLYPHRVFKAFLFFLPGLPYRAVLRQWRACSVAQPQ